MEAAVFGLLGLIMAFSFYGAGARFEDRRHLVTQEANAIGTAYLRIDLLPTDVQPSMRDLFRRYVDVRSATYMNADDQNATEAKLTECATLQREIWTRASKACWAQEGHHSAAVVLLPALNEMIDITTTRVMATRNHPPLIVYLLLCIISLTGTLLVGYDTSLNARRCWTYIIAFAVVMSVAVYVTVELEFPRRGLIRVDDANQILVELRRSIS